MRRTELKQMDQEMGLPKMGNNQLVCMDWSYLETQGAKRRVGPPRVRTTNTEPKPNVNLKQGSDKPT